MVDNKDMIIEGLRNFGDYFNNEDDFISALEISG